MNDMPSCLNTASDLDEFAAIADRPRACGHTHFRVDFVRSGQQDKMLRECRFHKECAIGFARNAEIRECRKLKADARTTILSYPIPQ